MGNQSLILFELLQIALGYRKDLSHLLSQAEWKAIYDLAKKQSMVGVCFAALQQLGADTDDGYARIGMSEMLYLAWMGMVAKIHQRNEIVNLQCVKLQNMLNGAGYRNYIMKGQANACMYIVDVEGCESNRLTSLRQPGDIDVYVEGGLADVLAYARTVGETTGVNELEMHVKVFEDTEVELHYRPFIMRNPFKNKVLQSFFDSQAEACFENRVSLNGNNENSEDDSVFWITAPTTTFNLVHQLAHIHLHLFTEGVGLRQLMDYYFVLKSHLRSPSKDKDSKIVRAVVEDLGLQRFASALMWALHTVFGLEREAMLWEPDQKDGKFLLDEIMRSGNFGHQDEALALKKRNRGYGLWVLFCRNLKLWRFDYTDWMMGPMWRIYHRVWRMKNGFE